MGKNKKYVRLFSAMLSFAVAFSALPGEPAYASGENAIEFKTASYNEEAVDKALDAVNRAKKTGRQADIDKAKELVNALSPTNKVRLYVRLSKDYYLKNYKNPGFKFFYVKKYIEDNPDVKKAAASQGVSNIDAFSLEHYLEFGVYEARGSKTAFDPVAAILADPAILSEVLFGDAPLPEAVYSRYSGKSGRDNTSDILVSFSAPKDEDGDIDEDPYTYVLFVDEYDYDDDYREDINDGRQEEAAPGTDNGQESDTEQPDPEPISPSPINPTPIDPSPIDPSPDPGRKSEPDFINTKTEVITPYRLYGQPGINSTFSFTTSGSYKNPNADQQVSVAFFGENYARAHELAKGKKYTLMIYMCGTDQEIDTAYRRLSIQMASMAKANVSDINVLLFVGGTNKYYNSYVDQDAADKSTLGASGLGTGIYYLNPEGLSEDVRQRLSEADFFDNNVLGILDGTVKDEKNVLKGLTLNDIINADSFIQLAYTTAIDMGDPSLLAGFINFSTNLFPAADYGLSLSDHGGGVNDGVCSSDDLKDGDVTIIRGSEISIPKLESALASTDLYKNKATPNGDGKLGLLFFDACLMGSTEIAYNTQGYYRYMVGSEDITMSYTDYAKLLTTLNSDVVNASSDRSIAVNLSKGFAQSEWHKGADSLGKMGAIAVYSSDEMEEMYDRLNALSREMTTILNSDSYSANLKNDVFLAIRKASLSCYPATGSSHGISKKIDETEFIDIGEFFTFLKTNLDALKPGDAGYTAEDSQALSKVASALDEVLDSGFLVYLSLQNLNGIGELSKEAGNGAIPLNYSVDGAETLWTDVRTGKTGTKDYLYGSSIRMPLGGTVKDFTDSTYYEYYADSPLKDYAGFIKAYLTYYNDENGYKKQRTELAKEITSNMYSKLIEPTDGNSGYFSTISENGKEYSYITFKVAESYKEAGLDAPAHSTGNPMLDILDTQGSIQIAAVHREYFKSVSTNNDDNDKYLRVDMICAEEEIDDYSYALGSNTLVFDVSNTTRSIIDGWSLSGNTYDAGQENPIGDVTWQFVLKSDLEKDPTGKATAVSLVFENPGQINPDDVLTIYGGFVQEVKKDQEDSGVENGSDTPGFEAYSNAYHVFYVNDKTKNYDYAGTVTRSNDQLNLQQNVLAISAYHYVLASGTDEDGNPITFKKQLENGDDAINEEYFATEYGGGKTPNIMKNTNVGEKYTNEAGEEEITAQTTAYAIDVGGLGENYTRMAYPAGEKVYEGAPNLGEGNIYLDVDKLTEDQIKMLGEIITEQKDYEGSTDTPLEYEIEEEYIPNSASDENAASQILPQE